MADVLCPVCGKPNPKELKKCQFCGANIQPLPASTRVDSQPIRPGEEPTKRDTSEFEKIKLSGGASIHPGEVPTKKNTGELERALPSWLRTLREGNRPSAGETLAEPSAEDDLPASPAAQPASDSSAGLPDWLSGLGKAASETEDEEIPEWLAGLGSGSFAQAAPAAGADSQPAPDLSNSDWLIRLDNEPQAPTPETRAAANAPTLIPSAFEASSEPVPDDSPDWLKALQSPPQSGMAEPPSAAQGRNDFPEWFSGLPGISAENAPVSSELAQPAPTESMPDWLNQLKQTSSAPDPGLPAHESESVPDWLSGFGTPAAPRSDSRKDVPDWLSALEAKSEPEPAAPAVVPDNEAQSASSSSEGMPDWLEQLKQKAGAPDPGPLSNGGESVPTWLSGFDAEPGKPTSTTQDNVPDWLSHLEETSAPGSVAPVTRSGAEPRSANNLSEEKPDWLSRLQADVNTAQEAETHKDDFEVVPEAPTSRKGTGPLPEWLNRIQPTAPVSGSTPALISDEGNPPGEQGEAAFAMETPDWLSKLKPEQEAEKNSENAGDNEGRVASEDIATAELPSWVQAMRPVESVVETKTARLDDNQVTEQSGPLAGLRGVLPATPGLGPLRTPPAYSAKLHTSDGQNRYAAALERLVAGETQSREPAQKGLTSNQVWRWLITIMLFLAVGIPLATGVQVATPSSLGSSDNYASSKIIDGLAGNTPVLVAFDYDPALSGELEAVAAPLMDQVLSKGIPLALISTSPTGPALAEHFLKTATLVDFHRYQSGVQYMNLGYLPGGPAGLSYFAVAPKSAMPFSVESWPAWGTGPLESIQKLSDFAAIIVLTDNADTGRDWIEQIGQYTGNTPMLMMISAQAEPMIRPYFDSGQLEGLVSGLSDAKIYEQKYTRPGLANRYWNSFSFGMLVAELLIVGGAISGVISDWRTRKKESGEEA